MTRPFLPANRFGRTPFLFLAIVLGGSWAGRSISHAFAAPAPALLGSRRTSSPDPGVIAHEWGTFTTISGTDGQTVDWVPVRIAVGEPDLPGFVEHFRYASYKGTLRATVRMETPVIYFYSTREAAVSVHVSFSKGLITEWYPHVTNFAPSTALPEDALYAPHDDGSLTWDSVTIAPNLPADFPREAPESRYYAARQTSAAPLAVQGPSGDQHEKFLFYRGASTMSLPLSAKVLPDGAIQLDNLTGQPMSPVMLFERRGDKLGYHLVASPQNHEVLETPAVTGTFDSLHQDLEDLLVSQGLFRDEARAMLETWRDSWFEEGSRLFYIVPRPFVDSVLPLSIQPPPEQLTRVFVGRIELVTPATEESIQTALVTRDRTIFQKYGRFFFPFFQIISQKTDPERANQLLDDLFSAPN
jgi:hypothetical protein